MMRTFGWPEFLFILEAAKWTIALSAIAFAGGSVVGLLVALARTAESRVLQWAAAVFTQIFQGTPLLLQLFLVFFGAPVLGLEINPWLAAAAALILNSGAFLGEIWRGCIQAVPRGQWEAAQALSLSYWWRMRDVVLPQAFRIAVPPTVGYLVQIIKGTSLAAIIGFTEVTRAGQIINNATFEPLLVFGVVAAIYFVLCWPLSLAAARLERRQKAALAR
ncbi:MAG: L-cystine transport system permease protein TcyB [Paracidovorax wautersii]|uniref:L-cystine transport system permease protein TcyB n=1 Tax=Paracidovorax wautersii TaxID=1177982 RepID=A0A7V8FLT3_9BURK|nr:MAG: L-cystine transport system permease protein TcyB [Paracidovorax wautersii]